MRVLLTGMSGTGKSTAIGLLAARGFPAVDVDDAGWTRPGPDGAALWDDQRVQAFLDEHAGEIAFLSGCADNQVRFYPQFARIVLLSAPRDVLLRRLETRTNSPYGKSPAERAEVLRNLEVVEPLLRRGAHHEIVTTIPPLEVVAEILALVHGHHAT